nr:PepSY domain-containing protein [Aquisediminimonas sediminicola]
MVHRWIGIITCLLFAMWFASGLVMAYVPFPDLTETERLVGQEPIDWARVGVVPAGTVDALPLTIPRLTMMAGRPVWRMGGHGPDLCAGTAKTVAPVSGDEAASLAKRFARSTAAGQWRQIERDQWTVAGRYDQYRPLWQVDLDDADGTRLYVATATGEVVLDTTRRERGWNWVGAIPHWLYLTILRKDRPLWRQVILWTSGIAIVGAVTGMWIGILRVRLLRRYARGRLTPYCGWAKWHHLAGLLGGITLITWIVSGWLSVDPNRWFASPGLPDAAYSAFAGGVAPRRAFDLARLAEVPSARGITELRLRRADGRTILDLRGPHGRRVLLDAAQLAPVHLDESRLIRAAGRMLPAYSIVGADRISAEDEYYYSHDNSLRLPVLRLAFDDPSRTQVYIDPATGEIALETDRIRRAYRWWFDALHCLDFKGLGSVRPAWDIVLWLLAGLGLILSASGVMIGWRRLFRN